MVLVFVAMGDLRQTIAAEDPSFRRGQAPQRVSVVSPAEKVEVDAACDDLWSRMEAAAHAIEDREHVQSANQPSWANSASQPSWADCEGPSWLREGTDETTRARDELDGKIAEFEASCR